jgi:hypothetical protein
MASRGTAWACSSVPTQSSLFETAFAARRALPARGRGRVSPRPSRALPARPVAPPSAEPARSFAEHLADLAADADADESRADRADESRGDESRADESRADESPAGGAPPIADEELREHRDALLDFGREYTERENGVRSVAAFVSWLDLATRNDAGSERGVDLVTFHRAKGLEWQVVFVTGLERGLVPISWRRHRGLPRSVASSTSRQPLKRAAPLGAPAAAAGRRSPRQRRGPPTSKQAIAESPSPGRPAARIGDVSQPQESTPPARRARDGLRADPTSVSRRMHRYARTQRMADLVFAYMRERLALEPVPLDHGVAPEELAARAPNLIGAAGNDPEIVLAQYSEVLAPAVISSDSPRFLAFIPAAPTKAALLFDMIVSCASISGISWLEAAGAVHAENQALRFLSDLAGMPASGRRVRAGRIGGEPVGFVVASTAAFGSATAAGSGSR